MYDDAGIDFVCAQFLDFWFKNSTLEDFSLCPQWLFDAKFFVAIGRSGSDKAIFGIPSIFVDQSAIIEQDGNFPPVEPEFFEQPSLLLMVSATSENLEGMFASQSSIPVVQKSIRSILATAAMRAQGLVIDVNGSCRLLTPRQTHAMALAANRLWLPDFDQLLLARKLIGTPAGQSMALPVHTGKNEMFSPMYLGEEVEADLRNYVAEHPWLDRVSIYRTQLNGKSAHRIHVVAKPGYTDGYADKLTKDFCDGLRKYFLTGKFYVSKFAPGPTPEMLRSL